ncbi:helix-turn-helix domain-containing protein [Bradyrhizobium sp. HKCCYLRH3099]|uniref:helix-turn-helix domain-containing protein n=1 Tax=unclassified Bradyrhizobium TaxID=2631580 RepID=UPI003EB78210
MRADAGRGDGDEAFFRQYALALRLWCRRFNTADIAKALGVAEPVVCRWIWHWRELSRSETSPDAASLPAPHNTVDA